jgi:hypothetical protein
MKSPVAVTNGHKPIATGQAVLPLAAQGSAALSLPAARVLCLHPLLARGLTPFCLITPLHTAVSLLLIKASVVWN